MILRYKAPDGSAKTIRLKTFSHSKPVTIGRSEEADVMIDDPNCSRVHVAIRYWDDLFVIRDMNSRNGTLVNGQKIIVAPLNPGDIIRIGNTDLEALAEEGSRSDVTLVSTT
jgi:Nif-specific regulatory protein